MYKSIVKKMQQYQSKKKKKNPQQRTSGEQRWSREVEARRESGRGEVTAQSRRRQRQEG